MPVHNTKNGTELVPLTIQITQPAFMSCQTPWMLLPAAAPTGTYICQVAVCAGCKHTSTYAQQGPPEHNTAEHHTYTLQLGVSMTQTALPANDSWHGQSHINP